MSIEDIHTTGEPASPSTERGEWGDPDTIAAELAALGELPLDAEETEAGLGEGVQATPHVQTVATLVSLAAPIEAALRQPLSELELARVYRRVVTRRPSVANSTAYPKAPRSSRSLVTALAVVAAAAAFVVIPLRGPAGLDARDPSPGLANSGLGAVTRAGLAQLGGSSGSARAQALADDYAARMAASPTDAPRGGPR